VHLFRLLYDKQVTYLAMGEHDAVIAAVAARDPDAAAYAMRRHILLSGERFRRLCDEIKCADGTVQRLDGRAGPRNANQSDRIGSTSPASDARRSRCPERCS
jgi:hypothetical protein